MTEETPYLVRPDEAERVDTLQSLGILDTPVEERFERITRLTQRLFGVPIAAITLVDADRQWFKSEQGMNTRETSRQISFCSHAILGDDVLVVEDASKDERFANFDNVVGDPNIRFYAGCPISSPDGTPLGALCIIDRTPRTLSEEELQDLRDLARTVEGELGALQAAMSDPLTGLLNRKGFETFATQLLALARRAGEPVSVLFADLDDLKGWNDQLGHEAGDDALRTTGELLTRTFRDSDVIARLGGDEFCVFLSNADKEKAANGIQRLKANIEASNKSRFGRPINVSVGAGSQDADSQASLGDLMRSADEAMYVEKKRSKGDTP